jgi:hypothetical protein
MLKRSIVASLLIMLFIGLFFAEATAEETWAPLEFLRDKEFFRFKITTYEKTYDYSDDEEKEIIKSKVYYYEFSVDNTGEKSSTYSYKYEWNVEKEESKRKDSYGYYDSEVFSQMMGGLFLSPITEVMASAIFLTDADIEVGATITTFIGDRIKITGKEKVCDIEGYVCKFQRATEDDRGKKVYVDKAEWVIAPDVGFPLRVKNFKDDGQIAYEIELVEYSNK